jgi:hypothetical protein
MTDAELATKAPESDAQDTNTPPPPNDSPAPAAAAADTPTNPLSEHCTSNRPTPAGQSSTGELTKLNDVDVSPLSSRITPHHQH